ncbi:PRC-barrel domain-containing protein [Sneathiella sp.]|uniref:PRC-barrel domain-containing protein n=1 Tax=Sneathiella sp. TaxID=1964365 RepID=UPI003567DA44
MNKKLLAAVSIVALISASPTFAGATDKNAESALQTEKAFLVSANTTNESNDTMDSAKKDVKEGWDKTKKAVSEAADDAADATKEAYRDFKAFAFGENDDELSVKQVRINSRETAEGIIGEPVYNNEERVGVVKDIIVDQTGKPVMIVVGDGDFFGLGKLAAFDYANMVNMNAEGDIIMPLTEESIERASEFSYDRKDKGENVRMVPENGYSVAKLLDANLINEKGDKMGEVEDISFKDDTADHLIVGYDKVLGFGGEDVAMPYDSVKIIPKDGDYDVQLSANRAAMIMNYKDAKTN